ncbi:MAG: translocation protein TolB [Planctomycetaceae bacterium]|nr:translocation protein TolB [Planctomycetaceae bacterium]
MSRANQQGAITYGLFMWHSTCQWGPSFQALVAGVFLIIPTSIWSQDAQKPAADSKAAAPKADVEKPDTYTSRLIHTNVDGSDPKQFTVFPEYTSQGSPEFSPDGKLVCFDVWKTGQTHTNGQIALVNADGTKPRILGDGLMPSFSPGGKRITFSRPGKGVWIMSAEGPDVELVQLDPSGWGTSWSSDGRIAYTASTGRGDNLIIVNIVEGTRTSIFDEEKSPYSQIYWNMAWSPDSKRIVFKGTTPEGKNELAIVDARGEKHGFVRRPFPDVHESFAWSPDGSQILVAKPCPERGNQSQLYSLNPDKDEPLQLLPKQDPQRPAVTASFSPDGKKLVSSCLMPVVPKVPAAQSK